MNKTQANDISMYITDLIQMDCLPTDGDTYILKDAILNAIYTKYFPIGTHKGKSIEDVPSKSLLWYINQPWFTDAYYEFREDVIVRELKSRGYTFEFEENVSSSEQQTENDSI